MNIEDPLNLKDLEVYDMATARYALKIANDHYYAVIHMREEMEKELKRSSAEVYDQTLKLVQKYVTVTNPLGVKVPISYVPSPIPTKVPLSVRNGISYMNTQLTIEKQRAEAELAAESEPLNEIRAYLENLVRTWFLQKIAENPGWLDGGQSITLGGCTLIYVKGVVAFVYTELEYGDD